MTSINLLDLIARLSSSMVVARYVYKSNLVVHISKSHVHPAGRTLTSDWSINSFIVQSEFS